MGYSVYTQELTDSKGGKSERHGGYAITAFCDHPNCYEKIDRGVEYGCHGGLCDESCKGFYCAEHVELAISIHEDEFEDLDEQEAIQLADEYGLEDVPLFDDDGEFRICNHLPIQNKETHDWANHVATDSTWIQWRAEYPEQLQSLLANAKDSEEKAEAWRKGEAND